MGDNATGAENQQGSRRDTQCIECLVDPSETTRRAPFVRKEVEAYFLGAIHDGTFSSNQRSRISQKGVEWLEVLKERLEEAGYHGWIYREGKTRDVYVLETLAPFLDFAFDPKKLKTKREQQAYIRGFFDAEGGIPRDISARFYIQLSQKDRRKVETLKEILGHLGIET